MVVFFSLRAHTEKFAKNFNGILIVHIHVQHTLRTNTILTDRMLPWCFIQGSDGRTGDLYTWSGGPQAGEHATPPTSWCIAIAIGESFAEHCRKWNIRSKVCACISGFRASHCTIMLHMRVKMDIYRTLESANNKWQRFFNIVLHPVIEQNAFFNIFVFFSPLFFYTHLARVLSSAKRCRCIQHLSNIWTVPDCIWSWKLIKTILAYVKLKHIFATSFESWSRIFHVSALYIVKRMSLVL